MTKDNKRTPAAMIKNRVYREDMTWEEEKDFAKFMFNKYEKAGFTLEFKTNRTLPLNKQSYVGQPYKILKRMDVPETPDDEKKGLMKVMDLPAWLIEFEDGTTMVAYPDDIALLDVTGMAAC